MASFLSGTVTYSPSAFLTPTNISLIISIGSSNLGLSEVTIVKSDNLDETSPISNLLSFERFPPQPKTVTSLFGLYCLRLVRRLSRLIAL